jgi:hypothetical protein
MLALIMVGCTAPVPAPVETEPPVSSGDKSLAAGASPEASTALETGPADGPENDLDHAQILTRLLFMTDGRAEGREILAEIRASGDTRFVAGLIDTLRYQRGLRQEIGDTLNALTGQSLAADWFTWVEWAGNHTEIKSFPGYPAWKADLFARIDPNFRRFVYDGMKVAPESRVEEIVWGGVAVDGIPALDNPEMIDPAEADYLVPHERVFGVSLNGDTRAYPARFLDWHEMFNDVVGGEPVSLAY